MHRHRHRRVHIHHLFGDAQAAVARAVSVRSLSVAIGHDLQTAIFDCCFVEREPHCQHIRRVGFGKDHAAVLVPTGGGDQGLAVVVFRHQVFGRLDAHVLHGVGPDLRADDRFSRVEQGRVAQAAEDGRSGPEGRVGLDAVLRQREIEILRVHFAAVDDDLRQAFAEG